MNTAPREISDFFKPGGKLAQSHPQYEFRPQQAEMATAVRQAIEDRLTLMVEAGTGVGKSLAYLYPFLVWSSGSGKKVAVSTETKTLQQQLIEKDVPFLIRETGLSLRAELCVGAVNYLCRLRLSRCEQYGLFESKQSIRHYRKIVEWSGKSDTGLVLDLDFIPRPEVWSAVRVETDLCLHRKCPYFSDCFYYRARQRREKADILVMNHHLFFANLASGGAVLPRFEAVVFDEAHSLEEVATKFLGREISNYRLPKLLGYLFSLRTGRGFLPAHIRKKSELADWRALFEKLLDSNKVFFEGLGERLGGKQTVRLRKKEWDDEELTEQVGELSQRLNKFREEISDEEDREELARYLNRGRELAADLDDILNLKSEESVYWYEERGRGRRPRRTLKRAPLEVGEYLQKLLWSKFAPVILTSATLSTEGSFNYLRGRLGLEEARELVLTSPFDYRKSVLLYVNPGIPDPSSRKAEYEERVIREVGEIVHLVGGGVFALFTSYRMLFRAYEELEDKLRDFVCLKQGDQDRYHLLEEFRSRPGSVLFGTASFWQGVDVPGQSLKCVIIAKLPFAVPDDPVTAARIERVKEEGGNPFREFQLPRAIIMLRQGFGRLIRHRRDYGIVAILDPRLRTRHYGRAFASSLPSCLVTSDLSNLRRFLDEKEV